MIHCRHDAEDDEPIMDPDLETAYQRRRRRGQPVQSSLNVNAPIFQPSSTLTMASAPGDVQGLQPLAGTSASEGLAIS